MLAFCACKLAGQSRNLIVAALVYSLVTGRTADPRVSMRNACQAQVPMPEDEDHVDPRLWFYALCQRVTVGPAGKLPLDTVINRCEEKRKRVFTPDHRRRGDDHG